MINKPKAGQPPVTFGTDYPTPDGTCDHNFVDVRDIARAHIAAEIKGGVAAVEKERRAGDPAFLCAGVRLIKNAYGFSTKYLLESRMESLF